MEYRLLCTRCGAQSRNYSSFRCRKCNSILEVTYNYKDMKLPSGFRSARPRNSKYIPLLPVDSFEADLGEGGTPLVADGSADFPGTDVYFKLETRNPTHSFKDRGSAVEMTKAVEFGYGHVACASTGNMGMSLAHYAKEMGIKATIFISEDGNPVKIRKIRKYGAQVRKVRGDFNEALKEAEAFAGSGAAFLCGDYHYRKEGQKTVMFEILDQLRHEVPDFVALPVGNATLLAATYKAVTEYKALGITDKFPRIIAVQASGCDPLVKAYNRKEKLVYSRPKTIADAIAVGYPTFGTQGIEALRATKGMAIRVTDQEIVSAVSSLEQRGIYAETGGATGFAGFAKACKSYRSLFKGKRAVVLVTGNNERTHARR